MRMGCLLNTYGIPRQETEEWAARQFTDYDGDAAGIIRPCYRHTDEHNTRPLTGNGSASSEEEGYANVAEIEKFLVSQALFRQNIITRQCEVAKPLTTFPASLHIPRSPTEMSTLCGAV